MAPIFSIGGIYRLQLFLGPVDKTFDKVSIALDLEFQERTFQTTPKDLFLCQLAKGDTLSLKGIGLT